MKKSAPHAPAAGTARKETSRRLQRSPGRTSSDRFRAPLFGVVREIFHVLNALVDVALGIAVIHLPAELGQRPEAVAFGPQVDEAVDVQRSRRSPARGSPSRPARRSAPHNSALTAASPSCTPVDTATSSCGSGRRAERHAAQDVAQFRRLAERIAVRRRSCAPRRYRVRRSG